jgi:hypothetical protein
MQVKQCAGCKEIKSLICFGINRREEDGLNRYCRDCIHKKPSYVSANNRSRLKAALKRQSLTNAELWDGGGA